jgi:putative membrane protein
MLRVLIYLVVNSLVILLLDRILADFEVRNFTAAFLFILLLTLLNWTILPVLKFFAIPFNFFTFGLANVLISLAGVGFVIWLIPGVSVTGSYLSIFLNVLAVAVSLGISGSLIESFLKYSRL